MSCRPGGYCALRVTLRMLLAKQTLPHTLEEGKEGEGADIWLQGVFRGLQCDFDVIWLNLFARTYFRQILASSLRGGGVIVPSHPSPRTRQNLNCTRLLGKPAAPHQVTAEAAPALDKLSAQAEPASLGKVLLQPSASSRDIRPNPKHWLALTASSKRRRCLLSWRRRLSSPASPQEGGPEVSPQLARAQRCSTCCLTSRTLQPTGVSC